MRMWRGRRVGVLGGVLAVGLLLSSLLVGLPGVSQQGTLVPEELVVGMVPSRAATVLQPPVEGLANLLLKYVQEHGFSQVKRVRAVIPESYTATVEALGTARIHIGLLGPLTVVQAVDRYGAIPIAVTKRGESLRYRGQFMAHLDGPFANLLDVAEAVKAKKTVKFSYGGGSTSASGFLFPCKTFKDYGILPGDYSNFKTVRSNHLASAIAVYKKDVDVGVGFDDVRTSLDSEKTKQELGWKPGDPNPSTRVIILGYTDWIPNDGVVAVKELSPAFVKVIKDGFVAIMKTPEGQKFGKDALDATDFVLTPEGYDMMGALKSVRVVANEIEPNLAKCENQ